jgi:gas vesicle protein
MTSTVRAGLIGAGIGGASMFLLDPDRGARRRALVRDKAVRATRKTRETAGVARRDLNNRLSGLQSRVRARFSDETVDDEIVAERVRAALGHVTSHPRAICANVTGGLVTLTGDVLEAEAPAIVSGVAAVRGVEGVQDEMRTHASPDGTPALQGGSEPSSQWTGWVRGRWSPTAILTAGAGVAAGAVLIAAARARANGGTSPDHREWEGRTTPPMPVEEGAAVFITESGILNATPSESEFTRDEFFS